MVIDIPNALQIILSLYITYYRKSYTLLCFKCYVNKNHHTLANLFTYQTTVISKHMKILNLLKWVQSYSVFNP